MYRKNHLDWSTINLQALEKFPEAKPYKNEHRSCDCGAGCYLDAPGYPSYFLESWYSPSGNQCRYLIKGKEILGRKEDHQVLSKRLKKLWKPLSMDHPRVIEWIKAVTRHAQNCFVNPNKEISSPFVYPSKFEKTPFATEQELTDYTSNIDNTLAVNMIRKFYPEYKVDKLEVSKENIGHWYEVMSEKPTPENCPGTMGMKHPVNKTWCQLCGWNGETK